MNCTPIKRPLSNSQSDQPEEMGRHFFIFGTAMGPDTHAKRKMERMREIIGAGIFKLKGGN